MPADYTRMPEDPHILVVDDDREIRELLSSYLGENGFRATAVANGAETRRAVRNGHVDLVVLDLMLPNESGLDICKELRSDSEIPIIMLTALGDDIDRIVGLEVGADDYVTKPFNPRELVGRIRAVLRRTHATPQTRLPDAFHFAGWRLDTTSRTLNRETGIPTPVGGADFQLLTILLSNAGRVVSRAEILEAITGRTYDPLDRTIDVRISRLRQMLGDDARAPALIKTVYGKGYTMGVPVTSGQVGDEASA